MKKRFVSLILTVFLVLSMLPYAVFADNAIVCPACGGEVEKYGFQLVGIYGYFYKCKSCSKWAFADGLGGLKMLSVGDGQILDAADENTLLKFIFNNGHLVPAEKAPSGIGRKDLPGYSDYNKGTPSVDPDGFPSTTYSMLLGGYDTSAGMNVSITHQANSHFTQVPGNFSGSNGNLSVYGVYETKEASVGGTVIYYIDAPVTGYYSVDAPSATFKGVVKNSNGKVIVNDNDAAFTAYGSFTTSYYCASYDKSSWIKPTAENQTFERKFTHDTIFVKAGTRLYYFYRIESFRSCYASLPYMYMSVKTSTPTVTVQDLSPTQIQNNNTITINNNTWNGNIYVDNSNNLTYIYPEYTTINENGDTITNISTNPIIYNNTTNQYYTYDTVTNNYYYITYEEPKPSATPAPTWTPGGGATRGGGVGRHPSDTDAADWTLHYYVLNNRRYDAYYALKKTEVNTETKLPWVDNKKYISTTQIPIANGQYTVSVPDGVYWRVWSWDEASQTLTGVNSSNWHSTINNFLFNATGEYIFEFCKADGSDFDTAKDVTLKLKNDKITDYEDGGTIVEEPTPSPSPEPTRP